MKKVFVLSLLIRSPYMYNMMISHAFSIRSSFKILILYIHMFLKTFSQYFNFIFLFRNILIKVLSYDNP